MSRPDDEMKGLTKAEVKQRVASGAVNSAPERGSRSVAAILRENTLTLFNAILGFLLVLILAVGAVRDALFGFVLVGNMLIGTIQELRAKMTLDRLSVLSASKAVVIRDGSEASIDPSEVVQDDIIRIKRGDQVVADGDALHCQGLEIDEALLTGESEPVVKAPGDKLLSGSFVVAGAGVYHATGVGSNAYAHKLTAQARRFKLTHSELRAGINRILTGVTWIIIPTGLLLFWRELGLSNFADSVAGTVAAMVGMIPQGLVLLTSIVFAVAVVALGKRKVLVQELPAVEGLARVDVVCFDKTGTLTEAGLQFDSLQLLPGTHGQGEEEAGAALAALAADPSSRNPTMDAIAAACERGGPGKISGAGETGRRVPFSSERKWSAVTIAGRTWVLGAPEIILAELSGSAGGSADPARQAGGSAAEVLERVEASARTGKRVLLLAILPGEIEGDSLPEGLEPVALVFLEEKMRGDAAATLRYFAEQGLAIKVISGDNPATVAAVAGRAGLDVPGGPVDGGALPADEDGLARVMEDRAVFGRVTAQQKQAMVKALQSKGHTVAMTGDGVNDTLAVKEADIGIAVGAGAAAPTKSVAELVLLDGRFATMPGVVAEGRRVIANMERVAYLFITKTSYAALLAIAIGVIGWPYPFLPRHLTLVDAITIGVPAFFLALAPSSERYRPGFVRRVLHFSIPAGALLAATTLAVYALSRSAGADLTQSRTVATITLSIMGLGVLSILARPLSLWRILLIMAMIGGLVLAAVAPFVRQFLEFEFPPGALLWESFGLALATIALLVIGMKITGWKPRGKG